MANEFRKWAAERYHPAAPIRIVRKAVHDEMEPDRTHHTDREKDNKEAIGGLCSAREAIDKLPKWPQAAQIASEILEKIVVKNRDYFENFIEHLGKEDAQSISAEMVHTAASEIAGGTGRGRSQHPRARACHSG